MKKLKIIFEYQKLVNNYQTFIIWINKMMDDLYLILFI